MSDTLRTALKGGGSLKIAIDHIAGGGVHIRVDEYWYRMTSVEDMTITAEQLEASGNPDGLIGAEISKLVAAAHINYEVRKKRTTRARC
jgi:hypothetical protein